MFDFWRICLFLFPIDNTHYVYYRVWQPPLCLYKRLSLLWFWIAPMVRWIRCKQCRLCRTVVFSLLCDLEGIDALNFYELAFLWRRVNTLNPRQNGRHFSDDIFKWIFLNENVWIALKISLKFISKVQINNILALVQMMAWHRPGDKPLSEPMMFSLLTHICVSRHQWVKFTKM